MSVIFNYHAMKAEVDRRVTNLGGIHNPHGRKAQYLQVMQGEGDTLIAVSWHRVQPKDLPERRHLIRFF